VVKVWSTVLAQKNVRQIHVHVTKPVLFATAGATRVVKRVQTVKLNSIILSATK
jgi:hypothetical protein